MIPPSEPTPSTKPTCDAEWAASWLPHLEDLAERLRHCARRTMAEAIENSDLGSVSRPVSMGAGDTTFGIDAAAEAELSDWFEEHARHAPLSVLTEDAGWRHQGPDGAQGSRELPGFDHGGPRICVDPVDGTRHLMLDHRSAWAVIALAGPGEGMPHQRDALAACIQELPDSRSRIARRLSARRGAGVELAERDVLSGEILSSQPLRADDDDRLDHGYLPFFAFHPELREDVARLAFDFFARIEKGEGAELSHCYDDQYICNAGQIALTILGTYRLIVDPREFIAKRGGLSAQTTKPYDVAGALLCAQEAGSPITNLAGTELDFPWDVETPLSFVAFANKATRDRALPHLLAALDQYRP
jgi:fructose-1,6-bisphosphatase/inositol monophosphatase family enzyme